MRSLAGALALLAGLLAGAPASAQDGNAIGAPQLRDFQLQPKQTIVSQPRPEPVQPAPATQQPTARAPTTATATAQPRPAPTRTVEARSAPPQPAAQAQPAGTTPVAAAPAAALPPSDVTSAPASPLPAALPAPQAPPSGASASLSDGPPSWIFFLAFAVVGLLGYGYWLRRQASERRALALGGSAPAPVVEAPNAPAAPRPAPVPRPWLDIELTPERARIDVDESVIEFELLIRNTGGSAACNVKLQARFFCSTPKQDQELADYFKSKPGDHRTLSMPDIPAGGELVLKGSVDIKRDRISALQVDGKLLFVPLIGINAFYSWGSARSGQTSKSFVIGRKADNDNEKMGPFRIDLGSRIYRTIGQRPHKVAKRV